MGDLKQQLIDMTAPGDMQPNDEMKQLLEQLQDAVGEDTPKATPCLHRSLDIRSVKVTCS